MILLVCFFPLAVYLLVLGLLHRRRHPLLVSGISDGLGLVFGVSGFLLFAGPAVISALSERWRMFWLLGRGDAAFAGPNNALPFWIFLALLYFLLVVGGMVYYFWRQRRLTAIHNAEAAQVERALMDICQHLGLHPLRSGGLFLFDLSPSLPLEQHGSPSEGVQTPPYLPTAIRAAPSVASPSTSAEPLVLEPSVILEVDDFPLMHHVALRWEPADSPLRRVMETELSRRLEEMPSVDHFLSGWLLVLSFLLMSFELAGAFVVIFLHLYAR